MDMAAWLAPLDIENTFYAITLGMPRLFAVFTVAPFMGGTIVTGQMRMALTVPLLLFLYPVLPDVASLSHGMSDTEAVFFFLAVMAKELFIGMCLGYLAGILFWIAQCAGFLMDNQRGASQSQLNEPLSQESTSPMGSFLFQVLVFLFFSSSAFMGFLSMCLASYTIWPIDQLLPWPSDIRIPLTFARQVSFLALYMFLIAAPVTIACFLSDFCLGLINRFAQQLNVFVLSMGVKSGATALLIFLYLYPLCYIFIEMMKKVENVHLILEGIL